LKRLDISPLRRPHGFFANGNKVYITAEANRVVARVDTASDAIDWMVGTGQGVTHMITGDTTGKNLYTANITAGTVTKIDLARANGGAPEAVVPQTVGKQPEGIKVSPDGKELWVGLNGEGKVVILDSNSMQLKDTITGHKVPIRITFTPDGTRALISDVEAAQVAIYDVATRKELKRLPVQGTPIGTVISGDGKRAYVASMMAGKIAVIDLTRNEVIDYIEAPGGPDGIALLD
jgi:DNA-binding beta-propeller fold protein YncE